MIERDQPRRVDRLETVLQTIMAAQETGICHAERGKGGVRETGTVVFLFGQIVDANTEGRSGVEALNRLQTWGSCLYTFEAKAPAEIEVTPPPEPPSTPMPVSTTPLAFISQIIPNITPTQQKNDEEAAMIDQRIFQENSSRAGEAAQVPAPQFPLSAFPPTTPNAFAPNDRAAFTPTTPNAFAPNERITYPPATPFGPTTPNPFAPNERIPFPSASTYTTGPITPDPRLQSRAQPTARAPYRLIDGPEALAFIDRAGLTRLHRHVFLLLDGKRDAGDLARITRHSPREIQQLLADLEHYGLIKQETVPETYY